MKVEQLQRLLNGEYVDNKKDYQDALRNLKPFKDYSAGRSIPLAGIEQTLMSMVRKYDLRLQYVSILTTKDGVFKYSLSMVQQSKNEWIGTVYDDSVYGLFAKVLLTCFVMVRNGDLKKRRRPL